MIESVTSYPSHLTLALRSNGWETPFSASPTNQPLKQSTGNSHERVACLDAHANEKSGGIVMMAPTMTIEELAKQKGAIVTRIDYNGQLQHDEAGTFSEFPDGWELLPSGDSALTRKVRKELHWVLKEYNSKMKMYSVVGTVAPKSNIEAARAELGGAQGAAERLGKKNSIKRKPSANREKKHEMVMRATIEHLFPGMGSSEVDSVLSHALSPGSVGSYERFRNARGYAAEGKYDEAARLAVHAYARHHKTNYDSLLCEEFDRDEARAETRDKVYGALREWEKPRQEKEDSPTAEEPRSGGDGS